MTRRYLLRSLAITAALWRFRPEPSTVADVAGPPGEVVFRNRNVGPLTLWWHRKAKSIRFHDCKLGDVTIRHGQSWTIHGATEIGECNVRGKLVIGDHSVLTLRGDMILNNAPEAHTYRAYHPISVA